MVAIVCDNYGNCPLADGGTPGEAASASAYACPVRDGGHTCSAREMGVARERPRRKGIPRPAVVAVLAVVTLLGLGALGFGGWALYGRFASPSCDAERVDALLRLDPQLGEMEAAGTRCLKAGVRRGDAEALALAVRVLRTAADAGSGPAAAALAALYDPLERAALETSARTPELLPPVDAALAARWYDAAAARGDAKSADAVRALRAKYSLPDAKGVQGAQAGGVPLPVPGHPDFQQRVLVKPGATLHADPSAGSPGQALPVFDIFYVYERRPGWLRVGRDLGRGAEGWLEARFGQDWQFMLVTRYAPPGQRAPVLFFRDDLALASLVGRPGSADMAARLVKDAEGGRPDARLSAIEDRSVDWGAQPYVMPVLETRRVHADDGRTVYLAKVASVNGSAAASPSGPLAAGPAAPPAAGPEAAPSYCTGASAGTVRHAVTFVVDTTASMGPYIEEVRRVALAWRTRLEAGGNGDRVSFGLVAFRNNLESRPGLEYVARTVTPLAAAGNAADFGTGLGTLSAATVSTHSFDEDTVAGLREALAMNWRPFCGARFVVLVTDAGSLKSDDAKARYRGQGLSTIAAEARERGITIFPVHLHTREAVAAGNVEPAAAQYREQLDRTGADGLPKYRAIARADGPAFAAYLAEAGALIDAVGAQARGEVQAKPVLTQGTPTLRQLVMNEMFSVQQKYLGAAAGTQAPAFSASWTSDRDLVDLNRPALEVGLFLTRRQLNQLAEQTDRLVRTARQAELETERFFDLLRMVSMATAQDPKRFSDAAEVGDLLPTFLARLPYRSDVLGLTAEDWRGFGANKQDAFVRRLEEKLAFYRTLEADPSRWRGIGSADANEAIAIVPLSELP